MTEEIWFLKQCDLFRRLTPEEIARLEPRCRTRRFKRGEPIYLPAESADAALVLAEGRVKIGSVTEEGKQTILALIEPGELFGELSVLDDTPREEFAQAAEKSTVVLLPADALRALVEQNPSVALGVTKLIGLRRRRIERRLKSLMFRSNRQRLVSLLTDLAEQYGEPAESPRGAVRLRIKLSHQDLASIIGSTRETVTVVLGELQQEGLVEVGRRRMVLLAPARLAAAANGPGLSQPS
ncbi:Crp/Fnr family transcriptional regulator [Botrimarina hoheduenensis]|uniref:Global nitrogen regulator n=1 Tax=Botrimarina hoheduenensis TaxID=2528000 RepID=A0A5C5VQB4_9BACT|nr:Crp/Fnr family transcriptional regulator [Botrimarina hoheduenensis]TWT40828.1 Global nitrogen regulator [Botrimarina hoheduenensis]